MLYLCISMFYIAINLIFFRLNGEREGNNTQQDI